MRLKFKCTYSTYNTFTYAKHNYDYCELYNINKIKNETGFWRIFINING